jgi:hypothetical protein
VHQGVAGSHPHRSHVCHTGLCGRVQESRNRLSGAERNRRRADLPIHWLRKGGSELNPLLGKHPSCPKVIGFKLATGVIHYLIADHLNDRNPKAAKVFQIVSIVVQAGGVALNFRLVL